MPEDATTCVEELRDVVLVSRSIIGRLIAVAALRDRATDQYRHALADRLGVEEVNSGLRQLHTEIFLRWLNLSLRQQTADLILYLRSIRSGHDVLVQLLDSAEAWIPADRAEMEHELFLGDLAMVLPMVREEL